MTNTANHSAFPQVRVLGLVECGTHAVIWAVTGPHTTSENDMLSDLYHRLDPSMLLTANHGFSNYRAWMDSLGSSVRKGGGGSQLDLQRTTLTYDWSIGSD